MASQQPAASTLLTAKIHGSAHGSLSSCMLMCGKASSAWSTFEMSALPSNGKRQFAEDGLGCWRLSIRLVLIWLRSSARRPHSPIVFDDGTSSSTCRNKATSLSLVLAFNALSISSRNVLRACSCNGRSEPGAIGTCSLQLPKDGLK